MKTTFNKTLKNCHFCKLIQGNHKGLGKILGFYEATNFLQKCYIFVVILVSYINVANLKEEIVTGRSFRVVSRFCTFSEKVYVREIFQNQSSSKVYVPHVFKNWLSAEMYIYIHCRIILSEKFTLHDQFRRKHQIQFSYRHHRH